MRVLIVVRRFHPHVGGAEVQARHLASALVQAGAAVTIVTGRYDTLLPRRVVVDGVPVRRLWIGAAIPIIHEVLFLTTFALYLLRFRRQYDVILAFQFQLPALVALILGKWVLRKTVVARVSDTGGKGVEAFWRSVPCGRWILENIMVYLDAIISLSTQMTCELAAAGLPPERIHLIPNGIPLTEAPVHSSYELRRTLKLPLERFILVTVGRIEVQKRYDLLLDAWEQVCRDWSDSLLLVIGHGSRRLSLEATVRDRNLTGHVQFMGQIPNECVPRYLSAADAFALTSDYEGLPNSLLEAMSASLPVVVSSVSGSTDLVEDGVNGLLFPTGDLDALVGQLGVVMEEPELRRRLGSAARRTIESNFTIEAVRRRYSELFTTLLLAQANQ